MRWVVRKAFIYERPDGHDSFWLIDLGTGFNFPVPITVMIEDFLYHGFKKAVIFRLTHCFFECVGIILLKGSKNLIDRVKEVDGVIKGAHDGFAFSKGILGGRGSSSKYVSRDSGGY